MAGNYHPHNSLRDVDVDIEVPQFFIKPRTALIGPDEEIPNTNGTSTLNTIEEIELGVIIGKPGKDISLSDAYDHVFGYTVVNDFSGREPGDMICTGVVPLPDNQDDEVYIKSGDVIEGTVEGVGTLSNTIGK